MNNQHKGVKALYNFVDAFNSVEKNKIINNLHFPHFVHSNGNEPVIYETGEDFWKSLKIQFFESLHLWKYEFSEDSLNTFSLYNSNKEFLFNSELNSIKSPLRFLSFSIIRFKFTPPLKKNIEC